MARPDFDVDEFLALPLTARLATNGPTVRPVWYLWEGGSFWILTGSWANAGILGSGVTCTANPIASRQSGCDFSLVRSAPLTSVTPTRPTSAPPTP